MGASSRCYFFFCFLFVVYLFVSFFFMIAFFFFNVSHCFKVSF